MCICALCLPVKADELDNAVAFNWALNQPVSPPMFVTGRKKQKEAKVILVANGNIIYKGKEYTPVANAPNTK